jgi:hypothetical protein
MFGGFAVSEYVTSTSFFLASTLLLLRFGYSPLCLVWQYPDSDLNLMLHGTVLLSFWFGLAILIFIWIGTVLTCDLNLTLLGTLILVLFGAVQLSFLFGLAPFLTNSCFLAC